ncbi:MAG: hypothetical protein ABR589_03965 [Chthoniobacterales bacterium]
MSAACSGDWILVLDHDEELSLEWQEPRWREILHRDEFTHFWLQRRWLTPSGNFIDCEPWWPDWQMRLYRNRPGEISPPRQLHERIRVRGAGAHLRTLAIHHHDLRVASRSAREEKVASYERLKPGEGLGYYYLFEDRNPPESALPDRSDFELEREILRMPELSPEEVQALSLRAQPPPDRLRPGELVWVEVELRNRSARVLCCGSPFPLNLSYHWLEASTRAIALFDGIRTSIVPALPPGTRGRRKMFVKAPLAEGSYLLQLTMVQENLRWLESDCPELVREFSVTVHGDG